MTYLEKPITVVQCTCPICAGSGAVDVSPYCRLCQTPLQQDDLWWATDADLMPCGHSADMYLVEDKPCPNCAGVGVYDHILTPKEEQARRRWRMIRAVFVLLLVLLPLIIWGLIIAADDPSYICGCWWYETTVCVAGYRFIFWI